MMDAFLEGHLGPEVRSMEDRALARLALQLFLAGKVDVPALRLERTLSGDRSDGIRLVVLAMLSRLRGGHPQSSADDVRRDLRDAFESRPDRTLREFDMDTHLESVASAKDAALESVREALASIVADPFAHAPLFGPAGREPLPLVVVHEGRMAFSRMHRAQTDLADLLSRRLARSGTFDREAMDQALEEIDSLSGPPLHRDQRRAVERALQVPFLVLTGGPGTGKTTVVSRILLALARCMGGLEPEEVALCAPTGRAKARLSESLGRNLGDSADIPIHGRSLASCSASTLHGLLGARPDGTFRHRPGHLLPHKVVVLDEASMADLPLFSAFVAALDPRARVVVVGDPDQLPSVEAGAVLADLAANPDLEPFRVHLTHTHRNTGEIAEICRKVADGDAVGSWLHGRGRERHPDMTRSVPGMVVHLGARGLDGILDRWLEDRFGTALDRFQASGAIDPDPLLEALEASRILCAVHDGLCGTVERNRLADLWLARRTGSDPRDRFLPGQQVMLTRNHPSRDLWNGDLGVVVRREGRPQALFRKGDTLAAVPVDQLEGLVSAWAVTVHKAQGSEFQEVFLCLPDRDTPVLTRQILYTAISRARRTVLVWGDARLADRAVLRSADRPGALRMVRFPAQEASLEGMD